jgi:sulfoxide reductase heme-binding subunit YedZ
MHWIKENWRWAALNLTALVILVTLLAQASERSAVEMFYIPVLVPSGKWAFRFLLVSLAMTPLNTIFGWRWAVKLRKPAGLWAFAFASLHFALNILGTEGWLEHPIPDWIAGLGVIALGILTAMAATSTKWAMRLLKRWWKRLHRLVYGAGLIVAAHALLEAQNKKVAITDPNARIEFAVYSVILLALLAARIPAVRSGLASLKYRSGAGRERLSAEGG